MITVIDTGFSALADPSLSFATDQLTQIDGVEYLFRFIWSPTSVESCWYLNLYDQDENPIALLVRLVIDVPLLRRFRDPRLPSGVLMCRDTSGMRLDIQSPGELGVRVPLVYFSADDPAIVVP